MNEPKTIKFRRRTTPTVFGGFPNRTHGYEITMGLRGVGFIISKEEDSIDERLLWYIHGDDVANFPDEVELTLKHGSYADVSTLILGNSTGCAGETSALLIVLAGLFLLVTGVASWRTIVGLLGSFAVLLAILAWAAPGSFGRPGWDIPSLVGWHLLAGGLLFGAVFMATDPVSSPFTSLGKWGYGIIIGASTVLIRHLTGYVEGIMFAILLGNIAAPVLDEMATRLYLRRVRDEG